MKRFFLIWAISTAFCFFAIFALNFFAQEMTSLLKISDAMQPLQYIPFVLDAIAHVIEFPAALFSHSYTPDWIVAILVAGGCVIWALPITYVAVGVRKN